MRTPSSSTAAAVPLPLLGSSDAARHARENFELAAGRSTPVLVVAETGSRAKSVAEALHARTRPTAPFVALDCGAAQPGDLERTLFGTLPRRTDAPDVEIVGPDAALANAADGTLFLENIDELPASAQRRLARVLRDGEVRLSGRHVHVPLRLVGSTARDLEADVTDGRFRHDLLRRLGSTRIVIAPLRHRGADIGATVERLVSESSSAPRPFTQAAITVLAALPWPGNIDELAALLERVLAHAGSSVTQEDVLAHVPMDRQFARVDLTASLRDARRRFERDYIAAVLERHQWRMSDAARTLGIERANLYRKARQLGIVRVPRAEVS